MPNGASNSLQIHSVITQDKFSAEINSWLILKYLKQVHSFSKIASAMQNILSLLHRQSDSENEAAVLPIDQDAGYQDENI